MATIEKVLDLIWKLEYGSDAKFALEQNPGETGLTYKGIYETAHPNWPGWMIVKDVLKQCGGDKRLAGARLEYNPNVQTMVTALYKTTFWDKMRLDEVVDQHTANEIMIFGLNAGCGRAIRLAQEIIGVTADGVIGPATIKTLNAFSSSEFDKLFDTKEKEYYQKLVDGNPKFKIFANGWRSRAEYV